MLSHFTAKYTKIDSGYMGQLVEWPEVITEGASLEECREMLKERGKLLVVEPRVHVKGDLFNTLVAKGENAGLKAVDFPKRKGGRAVLFSF